MSSAERLRRLLWRVAILTAVLGVGVASGLLIGTRKMFPYHQLVAIKRVLLRGDAFPYADAARPVKVETALLRLEKRTYNRDNAAGLHGFGGGLTLVRGQVVGVDRNGTFFTYQSPGAIRTMNLALDLNFPDFLRHLSTVSMEEPVRIRVEQNMRVTGIAAQETQTGFQLYVSHHFWHPTRRAKSQRISRLAIADVGALLAGRLTAKSDAWEVVFESMPLIEFDVADPSPFNTNHSGGRMVFDAAGRVIFGSGDHRHDGISSQPIVSQDDASSYGKILRVDPESREVKTYAQGLRNPQGLMFDREGNLWATDHGPKGGDELNHIVEGGNYGWPLVTYGTEYWDFQWPLNRQQGRHEGFAPPIYSWIPSIGISNLIQVQRRPDVWDGDFLVGSLVGAALYRVRVTAGRVVFAEPIPIGERIRDLVQWEDGTILLWLDSARFAELRDVTLEEFEFSVPLAADEQARGLGRVLMQCAACHELDSAAAANKAPVLHGVYGRKIGTSGFANYSDALKSKDDYWNETSLLAFLLDPQSFAPGTTMPAASLDTDTAAAVVEYLRRLR